MIIYDYYTDLEQLSQKLDKADVLYFWGQCKHNRKCNYLEIIDRLLEIDEIEICWYICMEIMGQEIEGILYEYMQEALDELCKLNQIYLENDFDVKLYLKPRITKQGWEIS